MCSPKKKIIPNDKKTKVFKTVSEHKSHFEFYDDNVKENIAVSNVQNSENSKFINNKLDDILAKLAILTTKVDLATKEILVIKHKGVSNTEMSSTTEVPLNIPCRTPEDVQNLCANLEKSEFDSAFVSIHTIFPVKIK